LFIAFAIMGGLFILNRRNVHSLFPYLIGGVAMYFMLNSGVHATITGVLLAFVIPFGNGGKKTSSYRLQHFFTNLSPFFILPICNSKHLYSHKFNWYEVKSLQLGIMLGLVIGNHSVSGCFPLLLYFRNLYVTKGSKMDNILGAGMLGGIGFTMSIFITLLAFKNDGRSNYLFKIAILIASFLQELLVSYG
jgi:NhaA family Na+:H+ antiporter